MWRMMLGGVLSVFAAFLVSCFIMGVQHLIVWLGGPSREAVAPIVIVGAFGLGVVVSLMTEAP